MGCFETNGKPIGCPWEGPNNLPDKDPYGSETDQLDTRTRLSADTNLSVPGSKVARIEENVIETVGDLAHNVLETARKVEDHVINGFQSAKDWTRGELKDLRDRLQAPTEKVGDHSMNEVRRIPDLVLRHAGVDLDNDGRPKLK